MSVLQFHNHLDSCRQCSDQPFNLCATGSGLLQGETQSDDTTCISCGSELSLDEDAARCWSCKDGPICSSCQGELVEAGYYANTCGACIDKPESKHNRH